MHSPDSESASVYEPRSDDRKVPTPAAASAVPPSAKRLAIVSAPHEGFASYTWSIATTAAPTATNVGAQKPSGSLRVSMMALLTGLR